MTPIGAERVVDRLELVDGARHAGSDARRFRRILLDEGGADDERSKLAWRAASEREVVPPMSAFYR